MGTPHKYAELIKAWADGAKIQWFNSPIDRWIDIATPSWNINCKYRIKPEPKKVQLRFFEDTSGRVRCWTNSWKRSSATVEKISGFKQWLGPVEEREFDV